MVNDRQLVHKSGAVIILCERFHSGQRRQAKSHLSMLLYLVATLWSLKHNTICHRSKDCKNALHESAFSEHVKPANKNSSMFHIIH